MKKKITTIILMIALVFTITACDLLDNVLPQEIQHRVSFYSDNELIKSEMYQDASLIKTPTLENKEGYDFVGWYKDLNDPATVWNFEKDQVVSNLRLDALWEIKVNYLSLENVKVSGDKLVWDLVEDATYEVTILDEVVETPINEFSLASYKDILKEEKTITIRPIKTDFTGLESTIKVTYHEAEIIEGFKVEFDEFDISDFALNRSTYKTVTINQDDYYLDVVEAKLTAANQLPKNGTVALILRKNEGINGSLELKEGYENFVGLEFYLGNFNNNATSSKLNVYVANDPVNGWVLVNTYNNESTEGFTKFEIKEQDINGLVDLEELVYVKFVADIADRNIVLDDIIIYQRIPAYFQGVLKGQVIGPAEPGKLSEYYKSAEGLKGETLVEELRIIISTNINKIDYRDYKIIGETADVKLDDEDNVRGIYDLRDLKAPWGSKSEWHREHVWPNSRLGMDRVKETGANQASDPHNLRAIYPSINSSRSNRYYDNSTEAETLGHTVGTDRFYPGDVDKGDVARILMYMVVRYEFLGLTDNGDLLSRQAYTMAAAYMGKLSLLLDWHNSDPVDEFEINRNEVIYSYQNNRNPFIDHPELFLEVFNYFLSIDEQRVVSITLYFEFEINYSELNRRYYINN